MNGNVLAGRFAQPTKKRRPIKRARMRTPHRDLNMGQLAVLGSIAKQPEGTNITTKLIARDLGLAKTTVTSRLELMEQAGLIRRRGWEIV